MVVVGTGGGGREGGKTFKKIHSREGIKSKVGGWGKEHSLERGWEFENEGVVEQNYNKL